MNAAELAELIPGAHRRDGGFVAPCPVCSTPDSFYFCAGRDGALSYYCQRACEGIGAALAVMFPSAFVPSRRINSVADLLPVESFAAPKLTYLVPHVIYRNVHTLITGLFASGKTSLVYRWCGDLAAAGTRVLYLCRDNPLISVQERLARLSISTGGKFAYWGRFQSEPACQPFDPRVLDFVVSSNPRPLVVCDSFLSFLEADENDNMACRAWIGRANRVIDLGGTLITLTNAGKNHNGGNYARGATSIADAVDVAYVVTKIPRTGPYIKKLRLKMWKPRMVIAADDGGIFDYCNGRFVRDPVASAKMDADDDDASVPVAEMSGTIADKMAVALKRAGGPLEPSEIAREIGSKPDSVRAAARRHPGRFGTLTDGRICLVAPTKDVLDEMADEVDPDVDPAEFFAEAASK